jgi:hypothetical protein
MLWFRKPEPQRELRRRLLPVTQREFGIWAERIIELADLSHIDTDDQRYALARMLLTLPPDQAMETDDYFVFTLRKLAINSVAFDMCKRLEPGPATDGAKIAAFTKPNKETLH